MHGARDADFRVGKSLGKNDHIVTYRRPQKPGWMDDETYEKMPETIDVREFKVIFETPGFRTKSIVIVTTMHDPISANKEDLGDLFQQRWCVELDLRSIKSTMQMDILRCKTPAMVRKEIWIHLLAYNLIRKVMAEAAFKHQLTPRQISFKGAMQAFNSFRFVWIYNARINGRKIYAQMIDQVARILVGNRPGRFEPRAVKRRPKQYGLLTVPRAQARRAMMGFALLLSQCHSGQSLDCPQDQGQSSIFDARLARTGFNKT